MELREKELEEKPQAAASRSLPECWNPKKLRFASFPYSGREPLSLSTALISSSSNSSVDFDDEEAWPKLEESLSFEHHGPRLSRRNSIWDLLMRRPSAPV